MAIIGRPKPRRKPWHTDEYIAYLQSEKWAVIREAALKRAGYKCQQWLDRGIWCEATHNLEVHHRHYIFAFGKERPDDLEVLCRPHHEMADWHRQRAERKATLQKKYPGWEPKGGW